MKKFIETIILTFVLLISGMCYTYASTSSSADLRLRAEELTQKYKTDMQAPYTKDGSDVNTLTGAVNYSENDMTIPGKGGLDLHFIRSYDSLTCDRDILYRVYDKSYMEVLPVYKYDYTVNGVKLSIWVNIKKEEDLINTIKINLETLNKNTQTDEDGKKYYKYSASTVSSSGDTVLERDKTVGMDWTTEYKKQYYKAYSTQNIDVNIGAGWKLKIPHLTYGWEHVKSSTRTDYYNFFQDLNGSVSTVVFRIYESPEDTELEKSEVFSNDGYTVEVFQDNPTHPEGFTYNVKLTDKNGVSYYFEQSRWYGSDIMPKAIIDRFGNKITYEKQEGTIKIIDSMNREISVTRGGIKVKGAEQYNVSYSIDENYDEEMDPYHVLKYWKTYTLNVSKNNSETPEVKKYTMKPRPIWKQQALITQYAIISAESGTGLRTEYSYDKSASYEKSIFDRIDSSMSYYVYEMKEKREYSNDVLKDKFTYSYSKNLYRGTSSFSESESMNNYRHIYYKSGYFGELSEKIEDISSNSREEVYDVANTKEMSSSDFAKCTALTYTSRQYEPLRGVRRSEDGEMIEFEHTDYDSMRRPLEKKIGTRTEKYEYDDTYGVMTKREVTASFSKKIITENELTDDKKNIAAERVYEQEDGGEKILKSHKEYEYYSDGTLKKFTEYTTETETSVTEYEYNYTENGAYTVTAQTTVTDADGNACIYTVAKRYGTMGELLEETDGRGGVTQYTYDGTGRVKKVIAADGTEQKYDYSYSDNYIITTDASGNQIKYEYTPSGKIQCVSIPENGVTLAEYTYDAYDRLTSESGYIDSDGKRYTKKYKYDKLDRVITETTADENQTMYTTDYTYGFDRKYEKYQGGDTLQLDEKYSVLVAVAAVNKSRGNAIKFYPNGYEDKSQRVHPDSYENKIFIIDVRGKKSMGIFSNDINLYVMLLTEDELNASYSGVFRQTTATYTGDDSFCRPTEEAAADGDGNIIRKTLLDNASGEKLSEERYGYDFMGNMTEYRDSGVCIGGDTGYTSKVEYDFRGKPTRETNAEGDSKVYTYDLAGRLIMTEDECGRKVYKTFDEAGREIVSESEIEDGNMTRAVKYYDENGNVVRETVRTNKPGESETLRAREYEYDEMNRPIAVKVNDGTQDIYTQYLYDDLGRVTKTVNGQTDKINITADAPEDTTKREYEYDRFGNVTKTIDSYGDYETAEYNLMGLPTVTTDKKGIATRYTYNTYGSPLSVSTEGIPTIEYTYNVNNMPTEVTQEDNVTRYEYDRLGRLTKETENDILKTYEWDIRGNRTG